MEELNECDIVIEDDFCDCDCEDVEVDFIGEAFPW